MERLKYAAFLAVTCGLIWSGTALATDRPGATTANGYPKVAKNPPINPAKPSHSQEGDEQDDGNTLDASKSNYVDARYAEINYEVEKANFVGTGLASCAIAKKAARSNRVFCSHKVKFSASAGSGWARVVAINPYSAYAELTLDPGAFNQVTGWVAAVDIHGKTHRKNLTTRNAGSVSSGSTSSTQHRNSKTDHGAKVGVSLGGSSEKGASGSGSWEHQNDSSSNETSTTETSNQSSTGGGAGGPNEALFQGETAKEKTGKGTVNLTVVVRSAGQMTVVARSDDGSSTVEVFGQVTLINELEGVAKVDPTPEPDGPGPSTPPGEGSDGPSTPKSGGGVRWGPVTPGSNGWSDKTFASLGHDLGGGTSLPGHGDLAASLGVPDEASGLSGESAASEGHAQIRLDGRASSAISFGISTTPSGALDLPDGGTVVVPAGRSSAAFRFAPLTTGSITIDCTLLDSLGQPTSTVLTTTTAGVSLANVSDPELSFVVLGDVLEEDDDSAALQGLQADDVGTVLVQRTGYGGLASEATMLTVSADDPSGILDSLPSTVQIPIGETQAEMQITLTSQLGDAEIEFLDGTTVVYSLHVRSVEPVYSSPKLMRLPVGATSFLPIHVSPAKSTSRTVAVTSTNSAVVAVVGSGVIVPGGMKLSGYDIEGLALGAADLSVSVAGMASYDVTVVVVPAETTLDNGVLTLGNLEPGVSGGFVILAPEGTTFASVAPGTGASAAEFDGVGTRSLRIDVSGEELTGESMQFTVSFGGDQPDDVVVFDHYRALDWVVPYGIEVVTGP